MLRPFCWPQKQEHAQAAAVAGGCDGGLRRRCRPCSRPALLAPQIVRRAGSGVFSMHRSGFPPRNCKAREAALEEHDNP